MRKRDLLRRIGELEDKIVQLRLDLWKSEHKGQDLVKCPSCENLYPVSDFEPAPILDDARYISDFVQAGVPVCSKCAKGFFVVDMFAGHNP